MKAIFIPALLGAILAGGMTAALADVGFFGHIDISLDALDQDGGSDDINMNCTTCSMGFRGGEDLGNGLKAIFQADFQFDADEVNADGDSQQIKDRDQWIGLEGRFGKVRAGSISTVYKSHGAMIDPFYRTALQGRDRGLQSSFHSSAGEELEGRAENTVRWDSPDWNGVKLGATYTLDNSEGDGEDSDPFGVGASYSSGRALVFADYVDNNQSSSDVEEISAWKVGGKYGLDAFGFTFGLMGQYEDAEIDDGVTPVDLNVWHVGGTLTLGNTMAYLALGQGEIDASGVSNEYDVWTLAAMHSLSKRTKLYAGFNQIDCDTMVAGSACDKVGPSGGEDDKVSLGMQHKF